MVERAGLIGSPHCSQLSARGLGIADNSLATSRFLPNESSTMRCRYSVPFVLGMMPSSSTIFAFMFQPLVVEAVLYHRIVMLRYLFCMW